MFVVEIMLTCFVVSGVSPLSSMGEQLVDGLTLSRAGHTEFVYLVCVG